MNNSNSEQQVRAVKGISPIIVGVVVGIGATVAGAIALNNGNNRRMLSRALDDSNRAAKKVVSNVKDRLKNKEPNLIDRIKDEFEPSESLQKGM